MITLVVLYVVAGIAGMYGLKTGVDTYTHLDDNDTRRYEKCVAKASDVSDCRGLE